MQKTIVNIEIYIHAVSLYSWVAMRSVTDSVLCVCVCSSANCVLCSWLEVITTAARRVYCNVDILISYS